MVEGYIRMKVSLGNGRKYFEIVQVDGNSIRVKSQGFGKTLEEFEGAYIKAIGEMYIKDKQRFIDLQGFVVNRDQVPWDEVEISKAS